MKHANKFVLKSLIAVSALAFVLAAVTPISAHGISRRSGVRLICTHQMCDVPSPKA